MEAEKKGILKKYKIELIGANSKAISNAEDRKKFRKNMIDICLLYTSPSPRDRTRSRMPSSA